MSDVPPDPLVLVTPLLLTYNEEPNIARTLMGLSWARRIVVIDSGSNDGTLDLVATFPGVEVFSRRFDTHANQWNFGLAQIKEGWVLSLDADYQITTAVQREIAQHLPTADQQCIAGFRLPFRYCVAGRPLSGTVLPPRLALFRCDRGIYIDDGHTQALRLQGHVISLKQPILHDDRKPLSRWLWAQHRYVALEVEKLLSTADPHLSRADRLRKHHVVAPFAMLVLCLFWHRGLLDGWRGWFYALQRLYVEILLSLMLLEARHGG